MLCSEHDHLHDSLAVHQSREDHVEEHTYLNNHRHDHKHDHFHQHEEKFKHAAGNLLSSGHFGCESSPISRNVRASVR